MTRQHSKNTQDKIQIIITLLVFHDNMGTVLSDDLQVYITSRHVPPQRKPKSSSFHQLKTMSEDNKQLTKTQQHTLSGADTAV